VTEEKYTEAFEFLDELRVSGEVNMFLAPEWLEDEFNYTAKEARVITGDWMDTFDGDATVKSRVEEALAS